MKKLVMLTLVVGAVAARFSPPSAGDLEPADPPAPTMVTLQQIYDACTGGGGGLGEVPKTGQTGCWDASGTPIACAGTGQDGEYQNGVSVDPRFTDNGDGTVKDNLTNLIWLQDANCFGAKNWTDALGDANGLADGSCGLADGSVAGDWRLPNVRELHSLIDYGQFSPALPAGHSFSGVQAVFYWSSTTLMNDPGRAWAVHIDIGYVDRNVKSGTLNVWPVRGGQ